jgi:recombination protein RecR
MNFSSKLLEDAVAEFAKLPGVGQKTALRLVLHLLNRDKEEVQKFSNAVSKLRNEIQFCQTCHNISDLKPFARSAHLTNATIPSSAW